jgi:hypothetical protein
MQFYELDEWNFGSAKLREIKDLSTMSSISISAGFLRWIEILEIFGNFE